MLEKIVTILSKMTGSTTEEITEDTLIKNIQGWDSLKHIKIILSLEEAFETIFKSSEIESFSDVHSILVALKNRQ